jgi:predicted Zn-ribbon and HTH transcriptional regulator
MKTVITTKRPDKIIVMGEGCCMSCGGIFPVKLDSRQKPIKPSATCPHCHEEPALIYPVEPTPNP